MLTAQYSTNITVASCDCTGSAIGYLCGYIAATSLVDKATGVGQLVTIGLCMVFVVAALVASIYAQYKLSAYNYSQVAHVEATNWTELQTNKIDPEKADYDSDEQNEDSMHADLIALEGDHTEQSESLEENEAVNNPLISIPMKQLDL